MIIVIKFAIFTSINEIYCLPCDRCKLSIESTSKKESSDEFNENEHGHKVYNAIIRVNPYVYEYNSLMRGLEKQAC